MRVSVGTDEEIQREVEAEDPFSQVRLSNVYVSLTPSGLGTRLRIRIHILNLFHNHYPIYISC